MTFYVGSGEGEGGEGKEGQEGDMHGAFGCFGGTLVRGIECWGGLRVKMFSMIIRCEIRAAGR